MTNVPWRRDALSQLFCFSEIIGMKKMPLNKFLKKNPILYPRVCETQSNLQ